MALKYGNRVKETTTTSGTGTLNLGGTVTGFQTFLAAIGNGNSCPYLIDDGNGNWELTWGVVASGTPNTLSRGTLIASSTGSRISFGGGSKTVAIVNARELALWAAESPVLVEGTIASATTTDLGTVLTLCCQITGTTTITGFGTQPNALRIVRFAASLTLTHNATTLNLLGGKSRTTMAGDISLFRSDASGNWTELSRSRSVTRGQLWGLTLSTAGSSATFSVAAGDAVDNTLEESMTLASAISKTTSAWAVGNANGSLDTGSIANNTWYHVWLIKRPDTGVVDVLISLSATAPTMPANYTLKRRIGAMRTNGSAQWERFFQDGDNFRWETPVNDVSPMDMTSYTAADATLTAKVPTGIRVRALLNGHFQTNTGQPTLSLRATDEVYAGSSVQGFGFGYPSLASLATRPLGVMTNTLGQYLARVTNTPGNFYYLYVGTLGWIDRRGRDD